MHDLNKSRRSTGGAQARSKGHMPGVARAYHYIQYLVFVKNARVHYIAHPVPARAETSCREALEPGRQINMWYCSLVSIAANIACDKI